MKIQGSYAAYFFLFIFGLAIANAAASSTVWTIQQTAHGFQWVPPAGPPLCKYAGPSQVDNRHIVLAGQWPTVVPDKYADWRSWATAQDQRLKSWGFNAAGMYSYTFSNKNNRTSGEAPFVIVFQTSNHAKSDDFPYHIKGLNYNYTGMLCKPGYQPPDGGQVDAFDPGLTNAFNADVVTSFAQPFWDLGSTLFYVPEEADDLYGMNELYTHEDIAMDIVDGNPRQDRSVSGKYQYTDHAVYTKLALRDFLANNYLCSGSADPDAPNYCGAHQAAAALWALNNAWFGSQIYSTWNTSDTNGLAGIHNGTYSSYGTGTGLLDENGTHVLSAYTKSHCNSTLASDSWTVSPTAETDLHNFFVYYVQIYAQALAAAMAQPGVSPHAPVVLPIYNGPSYVYTAAVPYFDGYWIGPDQNGIGLSNDVQRIMTASSQRGGKSMPLVVADYTAANPDSPFPNSNGGSWPVATQAAKGSGMVTRWQSVVHQQDVNGKFSVVGFEHWGFYDSSDQLRDGGFVTADGDNPYDGSASLATATHQTAWQANHTYAAPALIFDGMNYQALSGEVTTICTSGSTTPPWAAADGQKTSDGTCAWRNEGPSTLKPEAGLPASATLPGTAYGDTLTPIANFLRGPGFCDPLLVGSPDISSPLIATGAVTIPLTPYQITATHNPIRYGAAGLPPGLSVNAGTGLITGTPTTAGTWDTTISATNPIATTSATVTIAIAGQLPPLPAPTLNLPGTLPVNAQISASYPSGYQIQSFQWTVQPVSGGSTGGGNASGSGLGSGSLQSQSPSGGSFGTPGLQANLGVLPLIPGDYSITVQAIDQSGRSSPASQPAYVTLVPADLSSVREYPNPWRSDQHSGHPITFDNLAVNTTIKIFTVSGHWVKTLPASSTSVTWDLTNDSGDRVASGIYLYLMTTDDGQKGTGKFVIIK